MKSQKDRFTPVGILQELKTLKELVLYYKKIIQVEKVVKRAKRKKIDQNSLIIKRKAFRKRTFNYKMKLLSQPAYEWNFKSDSKRRK